MGDPFGEFFVADEGDAEFDGAAAGIAEEGVGGFLAGDLDGFAEEFAEGMGDFADAEGGGAGEVDDPGGAVGFGEAEEGEGVGIALPDGVEIAHGDVHGLAVPDLACDVHHDTVAEVAGVVETDEGDGGAVGLAEVFEDALAAEAAHGVFALGIEGVLLAAAAALHGDEAIDVAGGKGGDAAAVVALAHEAGEPGVHGPGHGFLAGGAEFHAGHVDDVGGMREVGDGVGREEVGGDDFDVMLLEFLGGTR